MRRPTINPAPLLFALCLAVVLQCVGCEMERRVIRSSWDSLRNSAWSDNKTMTSSSSPNAAGGYGYTVELARYSGPKSLSKAFHLLRSARTEAGLPNLWYATRGDKTLVYAGRFKAKDAPDAKSMLTKVRSTKLQGNTPFENARIVPITGGQAAAADPHDLRSKTRKGLFTLQIGYYDRTYGSSFREAAEKAVNQMREDGLEAYYYHGPNRSQIMLNTWTRAEAFTLQGKVDRYSNLVRATQEKHPHNIPNGKPFPPDADPKYVKSQHSFLVAIP